MLTIRPNRGGLPVLLGFAIRVGQSDAPSTACAFAGLGKLRALPVRQGQVSPHVRGAKTKAGGADPWHEREASVSNPDSFISEVTEEVRRDRLYAMFRKYGWIGVVIVLGVVGGAAYTEWTKARDAARAQSFGDAMLDAVDLGAPEDRAQAMAVTPADGGQIALKELMLATDAGSDKAAALAALDKLAADQSQPLVYRDLATLRRVMLAGKDQPIADRRAALESIAVPGRAFRTLAAEQLAYLLIEDGKKDDAIAALAALMQDQDAPGGLRQRAAQMITALGGTPPEPAAGAAAEPTADAG